MRRPPNINWHHDLPDGIFKLATKRTSELVRFYGQCIQSMNIEILAASCYLQGIEDVVEAERKPK